MKKKGRKDDTGKLRWSLLHWPSIEKVLEVSELGARQYGDRNYRKVKNKRERYFNALMRHALTWYLGSVKDADSGKLQMAHVVWNALALLEFDINKKKGRK